MKSFFLMLVFTALLFACNNASESNTTTDSTNVTIDTSSSPAPTQIDTSSLRRETPNVDSALRK